MLLLGARAGASSRSRSRLDRLHNTAWMIYLVWSDLSVDGSLLVKHNQRVEVDLCDQHHLNQGARGVGIIFL